MRDKGWTQESLATLLGVSQPSVSKWLDGQRRPHLDAVVAIERLFGIPAKAWTAPHDARSRTGTEG